MHFAAGCSATQLSSRSFNRVRTKETGPRILSVWMTVHLLRPSFGTTLPPPAAGPISSSMDFPSAGGSVAERVPFQDRYTKEWPQLASEAAKEAANVAAHTLATGEAAPFVREGERVAIVPVASPTRADALMFHPGGRTVEPSALRNLPADVSQLFQPYLLPLFPEAIVSHGECGRALIANKCRVECSGCQTRPLISVAPLRWAGG